jgi:hypothetical protein
VSGPSAEGTTRFRIAATRSSGRLELELRCLVRLSRALRGELRTSFRVPWRRRLAALRRGFTSKTAVLYQLERNDPAQFVSDLGFAWRGYKISGFFNPIVGNKLILAQVLAGYGIPHPRVLALVVKGRLIGMREPLAAAATDALRTVLSESATVVFRPHWAGAGEGIFFLRGDDGSWSINGVAASDSEVSALIAGLDRYVVTAFVQQAAYAANIFPAAANTIRVLTLWDADDGPFVAAAVHRFGTSRSFPIDNWHQGRGGLCAWIDPTSGILGRSATLDAQYRLQWLNSHPETGRPIDGVRVPGFQNALDGILHAARCFPGAPCVGWDAVITDGGFSILEANSPPGLFVWQVHAPLLADERVARFFGRHGFSLPKTRRTESAARSAT